MRPVFVSLGVALLVTACTPSSPVGPVETGLPTPAGPSTVATGPSSATPSATPSRTPGQDELTKQAQAAYQVAFEEFERLSREGGADEPSKRMLEVEQGLYLEQDMALLRDQKKRGYRVEGKASTAKSRAAVGKSKEGSDPRLTLQVCEDRRGSRAVYPDGRVGENRLWQGFAYASFVEGSIRLVDIDTAEVASCDW